MASIASRRSHGERHDTTTTDNLRFVEHFDARPQEPKGAHPTAGQADLSQPSNFRLHRSDPCRRILPHYCGPWPFSCRATASDDRGADHHDRAFDSGAAQGISDRR
jgi:hypothetical protein